MVTQTGVPRARDLRKRGWRRSDFLGRNGVDPAGPELASTVSNAGGRAYRAGDLRRSGLGPQKTRALTDKPFGVNVILPRLREGQIEACLEESVAARSRQNRR